MRFPNTLLSVLLLAIACGPKDEPAPTPVPTPTPAPAAETTPTAPAQPLPELHDPVDVWEDGHVVRTLEAHQAEAEGYFVLDLGDDWVPYILSENDGPDEPRVPNPYRPTYLALARGEYPDDHHGARAREDKYLELYGIPPTISLLRTRMERTAGLACREEVDLDTLRSFQGFIAYEDTSRAQANARRYEAAERAVQRFLAQQGKTDAAELDTSTFTPADRNLVRDYVQLGPTYRALVAVQHRLDCEGYFEGKGRRVRGGLDWATHEALAEFERRHRVFGWGFVGRDTLEELRTAPMELERGDVVRVLTERALHAASVIEDGSMSRLPDGRPNTFVGMDGRTHEVPNLEREIREHLVKALGLSTPEATLAFLRGLGDIGPRKLVAVRGIRYPEYYSPDMDFSVEIDRGDVWYEFPYDELGAERAQPVSERPRLTLYVTYRDQKIPLARFGTTIGGWRTESVGDVIMWKYKESPPGPVIWERIVAAPVWLPPDSAPPRSLLTRGGGRGRDKWRVNVHETGPSYASAYGLVAAYHRPFVRDEQGNMVARGDEGIRTHGSVDYMSIMRRHSHGCHRLHNHIAVRMMSFILRHRPHTRQGADDVHYRRVIPMDGFTYELAVDQGGYAFGLARPIVVTVLPGRILGEQTAPIPQALPRFDPVLGGYVVPDGGAVIVDRFGNLTPTTLPGADGGLDGGLLDGGAAATDAGVAHDAGHATSDAAVRSTAPH